MTASAVSFNSESGVRIFERSLISSLARELLFDYENGNLIIEQAPSFAP